MSIFSWQGLDIDYTDNGEGPVVILVHGGASNNRQWENLTAQIKDRYRVLAPNLRGTGLTAGWPTGKPQPLDVQSVLIEGLANMPDVAGQSVTLVGHSYGAIISMNAALTLGDRVRQMILVEPNAFSLLQRPGYEDGLADINIMTEPFQRLGAEGRWSEVAVHFIDYWFGPGSWQAMGEKRQASVKAMMFTILDAWDGCMNDLVPVEAWQPFAERMVLITSANTRLSVKRVRDQMRDFLLGLTWRETPKGGHMALVNEPHLVEPVIIDFLDQAASLA